MIGPSGCDIAPALPAAPSTASPILPTLPSDENALSFEDALEEETVDADVEKPKGPSENTAALLFPFFTPPLILLAQEVARQAPPEGQNTPVEMELQSGENKLPPSPDANESAPEQISQKPTETGPKPDGMRAAKQPSVILNPKADEGSAAVEVQKPHGEEYQDASTTEVPIKVREIDTQLSRQIFSEEFKAPDLSVAGASSHRMSRDFALADTVVAVEEAHQVVTRSVDEITSHVQVLRSSGMDRLEVMVSPEPGTHLYLEITKTGGMIHIQARCDKGDFANLDAQWTHVQSSLASQGIRVEPLQQTFAGENNPQNRHGSPERDPQKAPRQEFNFEQDTPSRTPSAPSARPAPWQNRGWQRWA